MIFNRRKFLCGAAAATLSIPAFLKAVSASAATSATNTILVVVELDGGCDAFNTVVPIASATYGTYNDLRPNIAVSQSDIGNAGTAFDPNPSTSASAATTYGFHPRMPELRALYGSGNVACVMGVGLPAAATDRLGHEQAKYAWSTGTIGHFDQSNIGWLGATFDQFPSANGLPPLVSVSGQSPLEMNGRIAPHLTMNGDIGNFRLNSGSGGADATTRLAILGRDDAYQTSLVPAEYARAVANATTSYTSGIQAIAAAEPLSDYTTTYAMTPGSTATGSTFKSQLKQIARLILAQSPVRAFWAYQNGHDSHGAQTTTQPGLLGELSSGITEFLAYLNNKNVAIANNVVVMTVTDFGRRPRSNSSDGTDHGTAGINFVVGNPVKGGVYGTYPDLTTVDSNGNPGVDVDFRSQLAEVIDFVGADPTAVLGGSFAKLGFLT